MTDRTAERFVRVSKTGMGGIVHRGFESLPLRWLKPWESAIGEQFARVRERAGPSGVALKAALGPEAP